MPFLLPAQRPRHTGVADVPGAGRARDLKDAGCGWPLLPRLVVRGKLQLKPSRTFRRGVHGHAQTAYNANSFVVGTAVIIKHQRTAL